MATSNNKPKRVRTKKVEVPPAVLADTGSRVVELDVAKLIKEKDLTLPDPFVGYIAIGYDDYGAGGYTASLSKSSAKAAVALLSNDTSELDLRTVRVFQILPPPTTTPDA